jgi:phage-related protein
MFEILFYKDTQGKEPINNTFVLLHYFIKKAQKTPLRELEQVRRNLKDFLERRS